MKYKVQISTYITKTVEVEAESKQEAGHIALYQTDGNYEGIDFNKVDAGEFEVDEVEVA